MIKSRIPRWGDAIWIAVPALAFLAAFFVWPTLGVLSTALFKPGWSPDISPFTRLLGSPAYRYAVISTFKIAFEVASLCVLIGYPVAYWLSERGPRVQRIFLLLILLPYWTSALVKNFAWMVLLGRNGIASSLLATLGLRGDSLLYNRWVTIFGIVHTLLPLCIIAMLPVFGQIDRRFVLASRTLGASGAQAFFRVYLPLSMRGVGTAALIVFIYTLGFFITPALLGGPRETMIGQVIIQQVNALQDLRGGSALGVIVLLGALGAAAITNYLFGLSGGTEGGAARGVGKHLPRRLGLWIANRLGDAVAAVSRMVGEGRLLPVDFLLGAYNFLIVAILLLPVLAIMPMALTSGSFLEFPPPGYGTRWLHEYFSSPLWVTATLRSFGVGVAVAMVTLIIATSIAIAIVRTRSGLGSLVFVAVLSPLMVPTLVIAIGLFMQFARLSLLATNAGLIIGHTVIALPIVFLIVLSTLRGHDWRLDDAARTLGAAPAVVVRRITLPLIRTGLLAGALTGFLMSFEELTVALFVTGGLLSTLPKKLWDDIFLQVNPTLAAASLVVFGVVLVLFVFVEVWLSRSGARRTKSTD